MLFNKIRARLYDGRTLKVPSWTINPDECWAIIGTSGSGKTALSRLFVNDLPLSEGTADSLPKSVAYVSLEAQKALLERERKEDESDLLDHADPGTLVSDLLAPLDPIADWISALNIQHLLSQGFRTLSTGESRKVMLIDAVRQSPELLILDEPFEGLDSHSRLALSAMLQTLYLHGQKILWVANRLDELPEWITHLAFVHDAQLLKQGTRTEVLGASEVQGLLHFDRPLLPFPEASVVFSLKTTEPLVRMVNASIKYSEHVLFSQLNWTVNPGQHWAVLGPNGSGKTSLLQMITGDNPQCYRNELYLFGMKRGSGETIWDIKKHIGLVSSSLQWEYRATTNVLTTVISGLYDSIGLYKAAGDRDRQLAEHWLSIIGLREKANQSLHHLSYGEQRLVLIARALIKQPPLLILDEPCQGLDDIGREMVLAFIRRLSEQTKVTLLYVTHHLNEIPDTFDCRLILGESNTSGYSMTDSKS
ncbi:MAG: molybdate ABC transporter ATP-binding protein ModF [Oleibacter sp.]|nr:molybdate ABC transporter ATP-binding protein ModF [Thalassolituus sp.]